MVYLILNCSNNYGPNHYPEKLIRYLSRIFTKSRPVYGDGNYTRDWLYVVDHAQAIDLAFHNGSVGETYNIGGYNEWKNRDLVHLLCDLMDQKLDRPQGTARKLINYVTDRPGHDLRYAIDATKITNDLGWMPSVNFEEGLDKTLDWYLTHRDYLEISSS
jgi:dTDP-glucose 4,6-dehydratase